MKVLKKFIKDLSLKALSKLGIEVDEIPASVDHQIKLAQIERLEMSIATLQRGLTIEYFE